MTGGALPPGSWRRAAAALILAGALPPVGAAQAAAEQAASGADASVSVEVVLRGLDDPLRENVRRFLSISELEDAEEVTAREVRRRHRLAPGQIREALMPFGYYRPSVGSELEPEGAGFVARYRVEPGEPARLRRVDVRLVGEGKDFPALQQTLQGVELAPGERLVHGRYEAAKAALFEAAYEHGFLGATWRTSEIRVQPDRLQADVALVLDTGPRFYFGEVDIRQEVLRPELVQRFVAIEPGDPYDVDRLLELQRALSETDYFARVEIHAEPETAGPDQRIPVRVVTEASDPRRYTVGAGYGTDTGPRFSLGVLLRHVNTRGHRARADLQLSGIEKAVGLRYGIPIRNVATDSLDFFATARQEELGDADTDRYELGVSQVVGWRGFRRQLYLRAQREQFEFGSGPRQESDLVFPGIALTRERMDDLLYPRFGHRIRMDLRAGLEWLLSEVSFTRYDLALHWVRGLSERTRLLLRADAGILWTDDFDRLPPSQRFFAGGDRSVRGYAYQDIGPRNADGAVIGGERAVTASLEIERLFYGNYGGAVFVDAGDAFDDSPELKVGAGLGFRWRSPIGMVRLDLAHPFDDPDDEFRFHLTIGTSF